MKTVKMNDLINKKRCIVKLFLASQRRFKKSSVGAIFLSVLLNGIILLGTCSQLLLQHSSTALASLRAGIMAITVVFIIASPLIILLFALYSLMEFLAFAKLLLLYGASRSFLLSICIRVLLLLLFPALFPFILCTLISFLAAVFTNFWWLWICGIVFLFSYLLILTIGSVTLYGVSTFSWKKDI